MIHPREKPFNCSKFKTISSLKRHEMAHTREPPQGQIVLPELLNMIILLTCSDIFTGKFMNFCISLKFLEDKNNTGTFKKISFKNCI